jgi:hypothetical protein
MDLTRLRVPVVPMAELDPAVLYVWSRKQITQSWDSDPSQGNQPSFNYAYGGGLRTHMYEKRLRLSEDQRNIRTLVSRLASEMHVPLEVVDLGRLRHVAKRRRAREDGWTEYPVLVGPGGGTLVGSRACSEEAVRRVLRRVGTLSH